MEKRWYFGKNYGTMEETMVLWKKNYDIILNTMKLWFTMEKNYGTMEKATGTRVYYSIFS